MRTVIIYSSTFVHCLCTGFDIRWTIITRKYTYISALFMAEISRIVRQRAHKLTERNQRCEKDQIDILVEMH